MDDLRKFLSPEAIQVANGIASDAEDRIDKALEGHPENHIISKWVVKEAMMQQAISWLQDQMKPPR